MPPERVAVDPAAAAGLVDQLATAATAASCRRLGLGRLAAGIDLSRPLGRLEEVERWCAGAGADLRWRLGELARLPGLGAVAPGRVEGVLPAASLAELRLHYQYGRQAAVQVLSAWRTGDRGPARHWLATMGGADALARETFFRHLGLARTVRIGASLPDASLRESRAHQAVEAALSSMRSTRGWSSDEVEEAARVQPALALADDLAALVEQALSAPTWAEIEPLVNRLGLIGTDPMLAARLFERLGPETAMRAPVALLELADAAGVGADGAAEQLQTYQNAFVAAVGTVGAPGGLDARFLDETATILNGVAKARAEADGVEHVTAVDPGEVTATLSELGMAADAAERIARALDAPAMEMVARTAGGVLTSLQVLEVLALGADEGFTSDEFVERAVPLTLELAALLPLPPPASILLIGLSFMFSLAFTDPPGPARHCRQNPNGSTGGRLGPQGVPLPHTVQC